MKKLIIIPLVLILSLTIFTVKIYSQKEAAKSMRISQQTFSRVLKKAHKSLANGLVNGATIKIQGGYYIISSRENSPPNNSNKPPIP